MRFFLAIIHPRGTAHTGWVLGAFSTVDRADDAIRAYADANPGEFADPGIAKPGEIPCETICKFAIDQPFPVGPGHSRFETPPLPP